MRYLKRSQRDFFEKLERFRWDLRRDWSEIPNKVSLRPQRRYLDLCNFSSEISLRNSSSASQLRFLIEISTENSTWIVVVVVNLYSVAESILVEQRYFSCQRALVIYNCYNLSSLYPLHFHYFKSQGLASSQHVTRTQNKSQVSTKWCSVSVLF